MTIGRWDDSRPEMFEGQYGVYLMKKVAERSLFINNLEPEH
jgi:hypothetical protein